jgi:hypothetical protein
MIHLNFDVSPLLTMKDALRPQVEKALQAAARDLAVQTHAHITEQVQEKLHSTRDKYLEHLKVSEVSKDTWIITLDQKAMWIEAGMDEHEMLDDLLSSPKAKTAKDGSKYLVVPFEHKKGPTQQTPAQNDLTATVKKELSKRKIPYGKIETDPAGNPKTGLLHSLDIMKLPIKNVEGPGMGKGPLGQVRQGPTGIPYLQGIRIYQNDIKKKDGSSGVKRSIMTFRVASSKHKGTGRWVHPGLQARNFFEEAAQWAIEQWFSTIAPQLIENALQAF